MAVPSTWTMLLFCIILCAQALEQQPPRGIRSRRDTLVSSLFSAFSNMDKRLAALEASWNNSTEEQLAARLKAKMEGEMQEKLQDMDKKLQGMQDAMQRLESMVLELLSSRLETMEQKVAELMEAKTNATEERLASLEASNAEPQFSPASCRYQYLYRYEKEAPHSSGDQQRMTKLETELTRLQEKLSVLDKHLQDNDHSIGSLHNASVLAMEDLVHSIMELVAASEQSIKSTMENATILFNESSASMMNTTFFTSMMSDSEAHLLAMSENNTAVLNTSLARVEQTTKELATRMSALEDKLNNATSLNAEETENTRLMLEDVKNTTKEMCGPPQYRRTCQDYYDNSQRTSGLYNLELANGQGPMQVYCDMHNGTGWVVFQRREDGTINFYQNWKSYKEGFGDLSGEFWLGNRNIHRLTSAGLTQLRVDLQAWNGSTAYASYSNFSVGDVSSSYKLSVSGYSGTAGDSLARHNGHKFSTFDRDQDIDSGNCAQKRKGAWWYANCTDSNLNGEYGTRDSNGVQYVYWYYWLGSQSLQRTELKLK